MWLVDIEPARHPANDERLPAEAAATPASKATAALALHAIAKLLDPFLQILFGPAAEVLRSSLRAADTHRLRWPFRSCSVQGKAGKIAVALAPVQPARSAQAGVSTGQRRECAVHGQALKSPACRGHGREVAVRLFLLTRSQNHFGVHFRRGVLRIQHRLVRERSESHKLDAHHISPARHA